MLVEACVDSVTGALAAVAGGAGRLELCTGLVEGGLTPSAGLVAAARERIAVPIHVLIRPRGGDFLYDADERTVMLRDIAGAKRLGVAGVVLGALDAGGRVDAERTRPMIDAARPLAVTFHRAFDLARDPAEALDALMALGIERVLTSGQAGTAEAGVPVTAAIGARPAGGGRRPGGGGVSIRTTPRGWCGKPVVARSTFAGAGSPRGGWRSDGTGCSWGSGTSRSEERRVGKECRSRWSPYH